MVMCWDCIVKLAIVTEEGEGTTRRSVGYGEPDDVVLELDTGLSEVGKNVWPDVVWYFGNDQRVFRGSCSCEALAEEG